MAALMDRADQAVSVTSMARSFSAKLRDVATRKTEKLIVFKDNEPAAVILNVEAYQELLDELEDLRVERVARDRLDSFDASKAISHEDMVARFAD
ncbi:type II toxin-antitoxin system Phd/YefM family antitoxin [Pseudomonas sp. R3.Fl]|uniref:type II toxin-antitoxin system Phd/YefM family antitoxin n=1 Tax=Pseudomonas sp. R3.Fl TaxID=2928708 RepID=UPI00201D8C73|nr:MULTISPECIES: type II toxin-antitoxin system Phd/YefM family antitoxin [Pseudomonas]MCL6688950.1 type II toxin-antitoxin system Phd/YefM family antitoxin [Pseudomonas sp. R3.Fl]UUC51671.1 type II toxin-antitoxin system Phd/YefM family antitoxin [Pseudomonas citronellolis]